MRPLSQILNHLPREESKPMHKPNPPIFEKKFYNTDVWNDTYTSIKKKKEISIEQGRKLLKKAKPSKYRNKIIQVDGKRFDSKKEYSHFLYLQDLQNQGRIDDLRCQVEYPLKVNGLLVCTYKCDYTYFEAIKGIRGEMRVVDVKSIFTRKNPVYRLKKKLMKAIWGIEIKEV